MNNPLNLELFTALALLDAVMYGYLWELKKNPAGILFVIMPFRGKVYYPAYRLFQGLLDCFALYLLLTPDNIIVSLPSIAPLSLLERGWGEAGRGIGWGFLAFIIAWYLMGKEFLYYVFLSLITWSTSHFAGLEQYEHDKYIPYWLARPWFAGWWLFTDNISPFRGENRGGRFTVGKFLASFLIGMAILIISNFNI